MMIEWVKDDNPGTLKKEIEFKAHDIHINQMSDKGTRKISRKIIIRES